MNDDLISRYTFMTGLNDFDEQVVSMREIAIRGILLSLEEFYQLRRGGRIHAV